MSSDPRAERPARSARKQTHITRTESDDSEDAEVRWPEPSRLEGWWDEVMYPTRPPASA